MYNTKWAGQNPSPHHHQTIAAMQVHKKRKTCTPQPESTPSSETVMTSTRHRTMCPQRYRWGQAYEQLTPLTTPHRQSWAYMMTVSHNHDREGGAGRDPAVNTAAAWGNGAGLREVVPLDRRTQVTKAAR